MKRPTTRADQKQESLFLDFPPGDMWRQAMGVVYRLREKDQERLVSIQGIGPQGDLVRIWMNLENAVHLRALLSQLLARLRDEDFPDDPPPTREHPLEDSFQ